jgi:hypothetical protein
LVKGLIGAFDLCNFIMVWRFQGAGFMFVYLHMVSFCRCCYIVLVFILCVFFCSVGLLLLTGKWKTEQDENHILLKSFPHAADRFMQLANPIPHTYRMTDSLVREKGDTNKNMDYIFL